MAEAHRSGCPINLSVEVLGDSWSLVVIRDIMFGGRRHYRQLLNESEEGIASNILSDRLKRLTSDGLITKAQDPAHRQRQLYSLTEQAVQLVPVLVQLGNWGRKFLPASPELSVRAQLLDEGGPQLWEEFMQELRVIHLGADPAAGAPSVMERLEKAYREAVASS
ncbi:winged helix-turn-helix transcriptional regulator [Nesterenkonia cremea]|uniref:Transcriptional regulator n=1 Tax=Nesterenkonia cremea TaxID=1882340 RepID=A0A917AVZ1_9MICC|nr:helix-turn-helix domain-containing protein [Nesterenkonia cremea]GGE76557.1 transcriptional regulator [Nesterenkonia cremea]